MHQRTRDNLTGVAFVSPWLIGFAALILFPFAASLYWSFTHYDLMRPPVAAGWANYRSLAEELSEGDRFGLALWNTFYYAALAVPLSIALGVLLAVMLVWNVRGRAIYRTVLFIPYVVPTVAAAVLWMWLLDPKDGLVNYALRWMVDQPSQTFGWFKSVDEAANVPRWLSGRGGFGSKDALVLMSLWGVGNFMILYVAAIGDIPRAIYEAAALDGARVFRRFWHVTLPMLSPVIFFNLVMGLIQAVQAFTQIYIVSDGQGSPAGSTLVISLHLFLSAFKDSQMGYASAMAWILFVVVLVITALLFRTARHWVFYQWATR